MGLLRTLKPEWWFSAHLHTRFEATVVHSGSSSTPATETAGQNPDEIMIDDDDFEAAPIPIPVAVRQAQPATVVSCVPKNPDEITLDDEEEDVAVPSLATPLPAQTKFLALDKCLPRRKFLEVRPVNCSTPFS